MRALIKLNHEEPKSLKTEAANDAGYSTGSPPCLTTEGRMKCVSGALLTAVCTFCSLAYFYLPLAKKNMHPNPDKRLNDGALLKVTQPVPVSVRVFGFAMCDTLQQIRGN